MYLKQEEYKYNLNFEELNNEEIKLKLGQTVITSNKEFIVIGYQNTNKFTYTEGLIIIRESSLKPINSYEELLI